MGAILAALIMPRCAWADSPANSIEYIQVPNAETSTEQKPSSGQTSFINQIWPRLVLGPLGTADWWRGMYGLEIDTNPVSRPKLHIPFGMEIAAAGTWESISPDLNNSGSTSGPYPGSGAFGRFQMNFYPLPGLTVYGNVLGLLDTYSPASYGEVGAGIGWLQDATDFPWKGIYAAGQVAVGINRSNPYGQIRAVASWSYHAIGDALLLIPTVSGATIVGDPSTYPWNRFLTVSAGYASLPADYALNIYSSQILASSLAIGALKLKARLSDLASMAMKHNTTTTISVYGGAGVWGGWMNPIFRPSDFSSYPDGGLTLSLNLIARTRITAADGEVSESVTPWLIIELNTRFADLLNPIRWGFDMYVPLGPFSNGAARW